MESTTTSEYFLQGVPTTGVMDRGENITIINGALLERVATAAKLEYKKVNKVLRSYDGCPFTLRGRMDLDNEDAKVVSPYGSNQPDRYNHQCVRRWRREEQTSDRVRGNSMSDQSSVEER